MFNDTVNFASTHLQRRLEGNLTYVVSGVAAFLFTAYKYAQARKRHIDVPAAGPTGILSYYGAVQYFLHAKEMLQDAARKYNNGTFKVPEIDRWVVIVSKPELIEEIRKAPENVMSFQEAVGEQLAVRYTLGPDVVDDHYHIPVIRSQLTRSLTHLFADITDEIDNAFHDIIPAKKDEWMEMPALDTVMKIVCRISNRVFVGLPLCREPDYMALNIQYTIDVVTSARIINLFPSFLQPVVGNLLTTNAKNIKRASKHLRPVIEYRLKQFEEHGDDWPSKPNDILTWLMEDAKGEQRTVNAWTNRILTVNFAAIHTSSMSFTHALFYLVANQEYIGPIREEVERVIKEEGWTKVAMTRMRKLDSFMKESQRLAGIGIISMTRKLMKDYTLVDGTFLPAGTFISCNALSQHLNDDIYENASEFRGFRFADLREEDGEGTKHQFVSTATDYIPFGHGRHACPGRFFAANELKAMMAYLVMNYDIELEEKGVRPPDLHFQTALVPNPKAKVKFRARNRD